MLAIIPAVFPSPMSGSLGLRIFTSPQMPIGDQALAVGDTFLTASINRRTKENQEF